MARGSVNHSQHFRRSEVVMPEATVQIIMSYWRTLTKEKYNIYLNQWIDYCSTRDVDPFNATIIDELCFLTYIFESGNGYSSINSAWSALKPVCLLVMAYLLANNI